MKKKKKRIHKDRRNEWKIKRKNIKIIKQWGRAKIYKDIKKIKRKWLKEEKNEWKQCMRRKWEAEWK